MAKYTRRVRVRPLTSLTLRHAPHLLNPPKRVVDNMIND